MRGDSGMQTSTTLLRRVQQGPADQAAWAEFVQRYGPCLDRWCRRWGLQEADARDVTQDVLLRLAQKLRTFVYDPARSFRAWLKTLTRHAWQDFLDARHRPGAGSGDSAVEKLLQALEAREDLARHLEEEYDRELLEEAMRRVRPRVAVNTWEAFRLLAFEGLTGAEVASRLGMQVSMTFVAKSRVQKMIQHELRQLDGPAEE